MEILYEGKTSKEDVLRSIPVVSLRKVKSFGQRRLDGWANMLIFGDNLPILKALLKDPHVKGQVKLVYIDPPFATNQEYRSGTSRTATVSWSMEDEKAYQDTLVGAQYLDFLRRRHG